MQEYDTDKMLTLYGFGGKVDGATRLLMFVAIGSEYLWESHHTVVDVLLHSSNGCRVCHYLVHTIIMNCMQPLLSSDA